MDIETVWYEYSPYIYLIAGAIAIFLVGSKLAIVSGAILAVSAAVIMRLRWTHRRRGQRHGH